MEPSAVRCSRRVLGPLFSSVHGHEELGADPPPSLGLAQIPQFWRRKWEPQWETDMEPRQSFQQLLLLYEWSNQYLARVWENSGVNLSFCLGTVWNFPLPMKCHEPSVFPVRVEGHEWGLGEAGHGTRWRNPRTPGSVRTGEAVFFCPTHLSCFELA